MHYPLSTQTVSFNVTSAQSAAISDHVYVVRLIATTACHVVFGSNPTATTSDMELAAQREEYFRIKPGQKIAVVEDSGAGTLYITEMTQ